MLDAMRQAASGWTAKVLLLLLVVSFAWWGVSGQVGGLGATDIATVGDTAVSAVDYDRALRAQIDRLSQQIRQPLSLEQARAFGLTEQVLDQLIGEAALADEAQRLGVGVSSDRLAATVSEDPAFRGAGGAFDRVLFRDRLQNAGLTEARYLDDVRGSLVRRQVEDAVVGDVAAPAVLVEALARHAGETRAVSSLPVSAAAIPPVADPAPDVLQTWFDANKAQFRAPEYRKLGLLVLEPGGIADPAAIPAADVAAAYEVRKADYSVPERRRFVQATFTDAAGATAAKAKVDAGEALEAVAAGTGATDQGLKSRAEIIDAKVAEAVFSAASGATVLVADAPLGPAIVRVTAVEPGATKPLAEVEPTIRQQLAQRGAADRVSALYDQIEDERAGGSTLPEIATKLSLRHRTIDAVALDGTGPDGQPVADVPGGPRLLAEAFRSEVGVENAPFRLGDGAFVFYDLLDTVADRDRTLDEARPRAVAAWKAAETDAAIAKRADELFAKLKGGATLEAIAAEIGATVAKTEGVTRAATPAPLSANAVTQAFAGPQGHVANADGATPPERLLLRVDAVTVPPFFAEAADAKTAAAQATGGLQDDILDAYGAYLTAARPPRINRQIYSQITGEARTQ